MQGLIYLLTDLITGKQYVGQTWQKFETRMLQHEHNIPGSTTALATAIAHNGWQNFRKDILETSITTKSRLDERENHHIIAYNTLYPNGYNERMA